MIEESYRNYVVKCSGRTIDPANLKEESFIVADNLFGYYESLALFLKYKEDKGVSEIRKICGAKKDFSSQLTQIVSRLRTACLDLNPNVAD